MKYITEEEFMQIIDILRETFSRLEQKIDDRFDKIDERLDRMDERLNNQKTWLTEIQRNMAKKSQLQSLLIILKDKKTINSFEVAHIQHDGLV